jgi:hypothetical protein
MVGAVGIELKATLKTRKLLIPLNEENAKNTGFARVRYAAGTQNSRKDLAECPHLTPSIFLWKASRTRR